ncbi:MAG: hypothetical protein IJ642_11090 [Oscillospiraceae bacterium]|nr:hypothetical protein [Oscillospiraceae bacterium]
METEFCYISEKRYLNTIVFLTVLFIIFPVCFAIFKISQFFIFPVTLISTILFAILENHLSNLKGEFEADEEVCIFTLSKKELHFKYEEITGIELANFPENGRGGSLIGYKIKLKMRVKNMNYVIQQEMKLDYNLQKHPEQIAKKLEQMELTEIGNFLKWKTGLY